MDRSMSAGTSSVVLDVELLVEALQHRGFEQCNCMELAVHLEELSAALPLLKGVDMELARQAIAETVDQLQNAGVCVSVCSMSAYV